jgi:hypothetical protein
MTNLIRAVAAAFFSITLLAVPFESTAFPEVPHAKVEPAKSKTADPLIIFETYEALRKNIREKSLTPGHLKMLGMIFENEKDYASTKRLIERILTKEQPDKDSLYRKLYRVFILSAPNPDVLYGYMQKRGNYLVRRLGRLDRFGKVERGKIEIHRPSRDWLGLGQAAIVAWQTTREGRFLELFISTFDRYLEYRDFELGRIDHYRKRKMKSWGAFRKTGDNEEVILYNTVTFTGGVVFPVSKFCKVVMEDSSLTKKYGEKAAQYVKVVEEAVSEFMDEFMIVPEIDGGYFVAIDDERKVEPLNHSHYLGASLVELYNLTRNRTYLRIAEMMSKYFLASVNEDESGSYWWGYRPVPDNLKDHPPEPIWKGRRTIILPINAYQSGIVFTYKDMKALAKTFTSNIWAGNNKFNMYIAKKKWKALRPGNVKPERRRRPQALAGWIVLEEFDPKIRIIIEEAVATRTDLFPHGWFCRNDNKGLLLAYAKRLQPIDMLLKDAKRKMVERDKSYSYFTIQP